MVPKLHSISHRNFSFTLLNFSTKIQIYVLLKLIGIKDDLETHPYPIWWVCMLKFYIFFQEVISKRYSIWMKVVKKLANQNGWMKTSPREKPLWTLQLMLRSPKPGGSEIQMIWSIGVSFTWRSFLNFTKGRLQHRCFPITIAKFFKTSI